MGKARRLEEPLPAGNGLSREDAAMLEADLQAISWFANRPAYLGGLEAREARELMRLVSDRLSPSSPTAVHEKIETFLARFSCIRAGVEAEAIAEACEVLG